MGGGDDFHPHPSFLEELKETVSLLPSDWRCLYLCAGWLWGRKYRRCKQPGPLDPEGDLTGLEYHESKRFFVNCDPKIWAEKKIWFGGPFAVLVNQERVDELLNDYVEAFSKFPNPNDVVMTSILTSDDYVCMIPQLCCEKQRGGTTRNNRYSKTSQQRSGAKKKPKPKTKL